MLTLAVVLLAVFGANWDPSRDCRASPAVRMSAKEAVRFADAVPVWPEGRANETNAFFGFRSDFVSTTNGSCILKIAATTFYRVFVNGQFVGHGPVRAPHGYFRADEWPLDAVVRAGTNAVAVEVSNYNVSTVNCAGTQPGFLQAEVMRDGRVLCATGRDFSYCDLPRVRNTSRLTPQRAFVEMYRHAPGWDAWRTMRGWTGDLPAVLPAVRLLPRLTPYPSFDIVRPVAFETTRFSFDAETPPHHPELTFDGKDELGRIRDVRTAGTDLARGEVLQGRGFAADFGRVDSGFIGFNVDCDGPCTVYAVFDERLIDGVPDPLRRYQHDTMTVWQFSAAGHYSCEMFEPTAVRYVHVFARAGRATVGGFYLREYKNARVYAADFACSDARLNRVFAAARDTCAQCTMDATLDNSTRERNSGPCDAFFTLGAYAMLSGGHELERLFFENYAVPDSYPGIAEPMLPAFYPCDPVPTLSER